jgi:hypothetical protein
MEIPEDEIKELYEKTSRWQDFFYPIVERLGKSKTCILFAPWFDRFVRTYLRISFISLRYSLPVKDHEIPYTMTGGRRRRSIKKNKNHLPPHFQKHPQHPHKHDQEVSP